jgi:hypothetical protein
MKVKVNRRLSSVFYHVNFEVGEFTAEELQKMASFGIPQINLQWQGAATNLNLHAVYDITDSSNPNRNTSVTKQASVQILEAGKAVALCIFISKVPTADDRVALVSARLITSDFYRDAINEPVQQIDVDPGKHHVEAEPDCVVRLI